MTEITISELVSELEVDLELKVISGIDGADRKITQVDINRPGLALVKYFKHFGWQRIQILGRGEISYLSDLSDEERRDVLSHIFKYEIPCFIVDWGFPPPKELIILSNRHSVPVISTPISTGKLITRLTLYLEEKLAEPIDHYGTLVDIYGIGVLLIGEHSVGKSECALELVERGHRLVADDRILIKRIGNKLIGTAPKSTVNIMEIRGIGIIDIKEMFGYSAICEKKEIELVLSLELWNPNKEYERIGLDEKPTKIYDVDVPTITIPVAPGRNISVIAEVAAINHRLKSMGIKPIEKFIKNGIRKIKKRD
ncbi:TPA: HPr(Ser) kinase/phosphatase [bacterium]|nr:HPr(Ser) kinase/phosphatase [bacterium]